MKDVNQSKIKSIMYLCNIYYKSKMFMNSDDLINAINDICYLDSIDEIENIVSKFVLDNNK